MNRRTAKMLTSFTDELVRGSRIDAKPRDVKRAWQAIPRPERGELREEVSEYPKGRSTFALLRFIRMITGGLPQPGRGRKIYRPPGHGAARP